MIFETRKQYILPIASFCQLIQNVLHKVSQWIQQPGSIKATITLLEWQLEEYKFSIVYNCLFTQPSIVVQLAARLFDQVEPLTVGYWNLASSI